MLHTMAQKNPLLLTDQWIALRVCYVGLHINLEAQSPKAQQTSSEGLATVVFQQSLNPLPLLPPARMRLMIFPLPWSLMHFLNLPLRKKETPKKTPRKIQIPRMLWALKDLVKYNLVSSANPFPLLSSFSSILIYYKCYIMMSYRGHGILLKIAFKER